MKIHYKIVIPFTLLFIITTAITTFVSISLISSRLELRVRRQIDQVAEMVARADFAINPEILERLKRIVDGDIITFTAQGEILAATVAGREGKELLEAIQSPEVIDRVFSAGVTGITRDITYQGRPFKVGYRPLDGPDKSVVAFLVPMSDLAEARSGVAQTMGIIAVFMVVVMFLTSHIIARNITAPLQQLIEVTHKLAAGDFTQRARVRSGDEIGKLAEAFNDMARQLQESEQKLLQSQKLAVVGRLAAGLAHDIRNPLSSIRMQAQLFRNNLKSGTGGQQALQALVREVDRIEGVVQGLLELARPARLHLEPGDINAVLNEALATIAGQLKHRKVLVERQLDANLPPAMLHLDRLKRAFLNILLNAAEAMPNGGSLTVATAFDSRGSQISVEISDEGVGIDWEIEDKVFDPFFSTKREGVGLGLANAKTIIEGHAGSIRLMARAAGGTRVIITLPASAHAAEGMSRPWHGERNCG